MNAEINELVRQLTLLTRRVDELVKPEVPLGLSFISEQVLTGTVASVTFSSIPTGFRRLLLIAQARTSAVVEADAVLLRFNGDTAGNYDRQSLTGNSATASAGGSRAQSSIQIGSCEAANSRASNFSPVSVEIFGYTGNGEKWILSRSAVFGNVSADADLFLQVFAGRWRSTAAITSITLLPGTGPNFVAGSEFQLYGVR